MRYQDRILQSIPQENPSGQISQSGLLRAAHLTTNNRAFMLKAAKLNISLLCFLSDELKKDKHFKRAVIEMDSRAAEYFKPSYNF